MTLTRVFLTPTRWTAPGGQDLRGSSPALLSYGCFAAERHGTKMRLGVRFGERQVRTATDLTLTGVNALPVTLTRGDPHASYFWCPWRCVGLFY